MQTALAPRSNARTFLTRFHPAVLVSSGLSLAYPFFGPLHHVLAQHLLHLH